MMTELALFATSNKTTQFADYTVEIIPSSLGKDFIVKNHYSRGVHNGPICVGLLLEGKLVGVCAFAAPSSEAVRASVFGQHLKQAVIELHRLVLLDEVPKNAESFFIVRALRELKKYKPYYKAVLSFADPTQNHLGVIYQATNALYCGQSAPATFYLDQDGRLRHPRQNGVNITRTMAEERGWQPVKRKGKYRYLYLIADDKRDKKNLLGQLRLDILPYPKKEEENGTI